MVPSDEGAAQEHEGEMDVISPFIAHFEAAEAVEPGKGAFDDPTVTPQPLAALNAPTRNAGNDPCLAQLFTALGRVVTLVGVPFVRPQTRSTTPPGVNTRNGIEGLHHPLAVVPVGS